MIRGAPDYQRALAVGSDPDSQRVPDDQRTPDAQRALIVRGALMVRGV